MCSCAVSHQIKSFRVQSVLIGMVHKKSHGSGNIVRARLVRSLCNSASVSVELRLEVSSTSRIESPEEVVDQGHEHSWTQRHVTQEFLKKYKCEDEPPARVCIAVKELPKHAMIEIECVAGQKAFVSKKGGIAGMFSSFGRIGNVVFLSGQIADNAALKDGDVKTQTRSALKKMVHILENQAEISVKNVLKVTVYLADISYYAEMNEAYAEVFGKDGVAPPARAAFAVKDLPLGAKVEIQAIAFSQPLPKKSDDTILVEPVSGASAVKVYTPAMVKVDSTDPRRDFVFCSGQVALDPKSKSKKLVGAGDIEKETTQALKNLEALLLRSGSSLRCVKKVNIFLKDMDDYDQVNKIYRRFFTGKNLPARACVEVKDLPLGALVEIECKAERESPSQLFSSRNIKIAAVAVVTVGILIGAVSYFFSSPAKKKGARR